MTSLSDISAEYICKGCCKDFNGHFDIGSSLKRLFKAAEVSEEQLRSVALRENISTQHLATPMQEKDFVCVLPTDYTAADILAKLGGVKGRRPIYVPGDGTVREPVTRKTNLHKKTTKSFTEKTKM